MLFLSQEWPVLYKQFHAKGHRAYVGAYYSLYTDDIDDPNREEAL